MTMISVYTNSLLVYNDPAISGFLSLHQHIQGKQRGWECRLRRDCPGLRGFAVWGALSLKHTHTRLVLTSFGQICVWALHPSLSLMDHCFLASQFPEIYSGQRNLCWTCTDASSYTQSSTMGIDKRFSNNIPSFFHSIRFSNVQV